MATRATREEDVAGVERESMKCSFSISTSVGRSGVVVDFDSGVGGRRSAGEDWLAMGRMVAPCEVTAERRIPFVVVIPSFEFGEVGEGEWGVLSSEIMYVAVQL